MNIKNFLVMGLVIAIMTLAPLSAADDDDIGMLDALDITPFDADTNVTIDGINFNVPKGYGEQKDIAKDDDTYSLGNSEVTLSNHQYLSEDGKLLSLQVIFTSDKNFTADKLPSEDGMVKKTINGKEGMYSESDGVAMFVYTQDGKYVQVAADKDVISNVIV